MNRLPVLLASVLLSLTACNASDKKTEDESTSSSSETPTPGNTPGTPPNGTQGGTMEKVAIVGALGIGFEDQHVDTSRAFPMGSSGAGGSQVSGSVSAPVTGGALALEIPQGNGATGLTEGEQTANSREWVVALIDSTKTEKIDQIVGFLGLDSGGDSMMKLPLGDASISELDFGSVSLSGADAVSSTKLDDHAKSFGLELAMLKEIANTDNIARGLKNVYANTSSDGLVYYQIQPFFIYKGNADETLNKFSTAAHIKYAPTGGDNSDFGYGFYFNVVDPATATFNNICTTDTDPLRKVLKFVPPSDLVKNSSTYNATNPLTNSGLSKTSNGGNVTCSGGEFYMSGSPGQSNYGFNFGGGGYKGAILPGIWKLLIDDKQVAAYDLAAYSPVGSDGKPIVYIPAMKLTINAENKIDKAEVKFMYWDKSTSTYTEITDFKVFNSAVTKLNLSLSDNSGINAGCSGNQISKMIQLNNPIGNVFTVSDFTDGKWRAPGDLSTTEKTATGITVSYDIAGVSVSFDFRPGSDGCN